MLVKRRRPGCLGLIVVWLASAFSLWLTARLVPGVEIATFQTALWVAAAVGLLNALVRPVLVFLTFPLTLLSLGLFLIVINAGMLAAAAWWVDGFSIDGFGPAAIGAIVLSLVSGVVGWFTGGSSDDDDD
jgi:putative membrane protein